MSETPTPYNDTEIADDYSDYDDGFLSICAEGDTDWLDAFAISNRFMGAMQAANYFLTGDSAMLGRVEHIHYCSHINQFTLEAVPEQVDEQLRELVRHACALTFAGEAVANIPSFEFEAPECAPVPVEALH